MTLLLPRCPCAPTCTQLTSGNCSSSSLRRQQTSSATGKAQDGHRHQIRLRAGPPSSSELSRTDRGLLASGAGALLGWHRRGLLCVALNDEGAGLSTCSVWAHRSGEARRAPLIRPVVPRRGGTAPDPAATWQPDPGLCRSSIRIHPPAIWQNVASKRRSNPPPLRRACEWITVEQPVLTIVVCRLPLDRAGLCHRVTTVVLNFLLTCRSTRWEPVTCSVGRGACRERRTRCPLRSVS